MSISLVGLTGADSKRYKAILHAKYQITKNSDPDYFITGEMGRITTSDKEVDEFGEISTGRLRQSQKHLSPEELEQAMTEYKSGKSIYTLAKQFGCHHQTISHTLKKHGIKVDNRVAQKRLDVDIVIAMYAEMYSSMEIAERFGVHPQTILRCLREHGVEIRKRGTVPRH